LAGVGRAIYLKKCKKVKAELRRNLLLVLTISGIFLGIILGFVGRAYDFSSTSLQLIIFPGELLLRLLKMLILPLIISSLITGLAQLDPKSSGKMGSRAIMFYISTTLIATITGEIKNYSIFFRKTTRSNNKESLLIPKALHVH